MEECPTPVKKNRENEKKYYRNFHVEVVHNGFIISIGCTKVIASSPADLLKLIEGYLNSPASAEYAMNEQSHQYSPHDNVRVAQAQEVAHEPYPLR